MEARLWNWLSKGFDGLVSIAESVTAGGHKIPEENLRNMLGVHERLTNVLNGELEKRGRAPLGSTRPPASN